MAGDQENPQPNDETDDSLIEFDRQAMSSYNSFQSVRNGMTDKNGSDTPEADPQKSRPAPPPPAQRPEPVDKRETDEIQIIPANPNEARPSSTPAEGQPTQKKGKTSSRLNAAGRRPSSARRRASSSRRNATASGRNREVTTGVSPLVYVGIGGGILVILLAIGHFSRSANNPPASATSTVQQVQTASLAPPPTHSTASAETPDKGTETATHDNGEVSQADTADPSASPSETAAIPDGTGLRMIVFKDRNWKDKAFETIDPKLEHHWGGSPGEGVGKDNFSIQWKGYIRPSHKKGKKLYKFIAEVDDVMFLWVNDEQIFRRDDYKDKPVSGSIELEGSTPVPIRIKFREDTRNAYMRLKWNKIGGSTKSISTKFLYPDAQSAGIKEDASGDSADK